MLSVKYLFILNWQELEMSGCPLPSGLPERVADSQLSWEGTLQRPQDPIMLFMGTSQTFVSLSLGISRSCTNRPPGFPTAA